MKVYSEFSLESPQRGDSNEYTQYTISQCKKENHPKSQICNYRICSKEPKNEFETAVVNEASVFEPLKFDCICTCVNQSNVLQPENDLIFFSFETKQRSRSVSQDGYNFKICFRREK